VTHACMACLGVVRLVLSNTRCCLAAKTTLHLYACIVYSSNLQLRVPHSLYEMRLRCVPPVHAIFGCYFHFAQPPIQSRPHSLFFHLKAAKANART
jgi:hypothetical protein